MKIMDVLKVNDKLKTYHYPIVKIIIAVLLITILILRNYFIHVNNKLLSGIVAFVCMIIVLASVLCIYISIAEIININERRELGNLKHLDIDKTMYYTYDFEKVVCLIYNNDIIDIVIINSNSISRIGSSSNYNKSNGKFFDKAYYIDETEYPTIEQFESAFHEIWGNKETIDIISIDGVSPKNYKI